MSKNVVASSNTNEIKEGMHIRHGIASFFATVFFILLSIVLIFPVFSGFIASFRPGRELIRRGLSINLDL